MITKEELNSLHFPTTPEIESNLEVLLIKMNQVRVIYNKPMIITSGLRSVEHHKKIYKEKGIPENKIPMGSKHLSGKACDVLDKDCSLMKWCKDNVHHLEAIGLWIEDDSTVPRVHFQTVPPKSGNRFFKP